MKARLEPRIATVRTHPVRTVGPEVVAAVSECTEESQGYFRCQLPLNDTKGTRQLDADFLRWLSAPVTNIYESCYLQLNQFMSDPTIFSEVREARDRRAGRNKANEISAKECFVSGLERSEINK